MKTLITFLASLIAAGMLLTACQKDNELIPATANENAVLLSEEDPDYQGDPMTNYPDPFATSTTIEYRVNKPGVVKLFVYRQGSNFKVLLVNGYHGKGVYTKVWNAGNAPLGKYIAELNIGGVIAKESMTKQSQWDPMPDDDNSDN